MPVRSRSGGTLAELLIALVLVALVGSVITRFLIGQRRVTGALLAADEARRTVEQAAGWIGVELAEAGKQGGSTDLLSLGSDSLTYRAWRISGAACLVTESEVRIRRDLLTMWRTPQAGRDSLTLYLAGDSVWNADWVTVPVEAVSESQCAGRPALRVATHVDPALLVGIPPLVPVRGFEVMQFRLYRSLGTWWLGARSVSAGEGIQPLAGPFAEGGIHLTYLDQLGVVTTQKDQVEQLQLGLVPQGSLDSGRAVLAPRNLP